MSIPELRHVLTLGGTEALGELLLALPARLQEGASRSVLTYLDGEWSNLTKEELEELQLPSEETVTTYVASLRQDIEELQASITELEGRIPQASEEEKSALQEELDSMQNELKYQQLLLQEVQERQGRYQA